MTDYNFGDLDHRQLTLRVSAPYVFNEWDGRTFKLSPLLLLNPLRWYRAIFSKYHWRFSVTHHPGGNHRCYCMSEGGRMFDGYIEVAGFSLNWFYSHYTGPVPCTCDEVIEDLRREREVFCGEPDA